MKEIARRLQVPPGQIQAFNIQHGIRNPQVAKEIRVEASAAARRRKKKNLFSPEEKMALLQMADRGMWKVTRHAFLSSRILQQEYSTAQALHDAIWSAVSEGLDYYDPEHLSKEGRQKTRFGWMMQTADRFIQIEKNRLWRLKTAVSHELDLNRFDAETKFTRPSVKEPRLKATQWELHRIPVGTRHFLRKLGLDLNRVAIAGFDSYADQIRKVSSDPQTGLTAIERHIVESRLSGQTLKQINVPSQKIARGRKSVTSSRIQQIESKIIQKIRNAIRRTLPKGD